MPTGLTVRGPGCRCYRTINNTGRDQAKEFLAAEPSRDRASSKGIDPDHPGEGLAALRAAGVRPLVETGSSPRFPRRHRLLTTANRGPIDKTLTGRVEPVSPRSVGITATARHRPTRNATARPNPTARSPRSDKPAVGRRTKAYAAAQGGAEETRTSRRTSSRFQKLGDILDQLAQGALPMSRANDPVVLDELDHDHHSAKVLRRPPRPPDRPAERAAPAARVDPWTASTDGGSGIVTIFP